MNDRPIDKVYTDMINALYDATTISISMETLCKKVQEDLFSARKAVEETQKIITDYMNADVYKTHCDRIQSMIDDIAEWLQEQKGPISPEVVFEKMVVIGQANSIIQPADTHED